MLQTEEQEESRNAIRRIMALDVKDGIPEEQK